MVSLVYMLHYQNILILRVSGELEARNHHIAQFAKDLGNFISGSLKEVCLYGGNHI